MDQKKIWLPTMLHRISQRFSTLLFSRLIRFENQAEPDGTRIRHYDAECEAVQFMTDTLHTRVLTIKFRCFFNLRFFKGHKQATKMSPTNIRQSKGMAKTSYNSDIPTLKQGLSRLSLASTIRNRQSLQPDITYRYSQIRQVPHKRKQHFQTQPQQEFESTLSQRSHRLTNRLTIIQKLNQLEENIARLADEDQGKSVCDSRNSSMLESDCFAVGDQSQISEGCKFGKRKTKTFFAKKPYVC